jgi:hypothetical protein
MKPFNIYVDTYVQTIDGEFKAAGREHAIEYRVNAADDVNALIIFRQQHPNLVVGACEEDISAQLGNTAFKDSADALAYKLQKPMVDEVAKISGSAWQKLQEQLQSKQLSK